MSDLNMERTVSTFTRSTPRVDVQNAVPNVRIEQVGSFSQHFRVKSLADRGCSFYHEGLDLRREIGKEMHSVLDIGEVKIPVITRLRYATSSIVGVEFLNPSSGTVTSIRSHFYLEYAASSMQLRVVTPPPGPMSKGLEGADKVRIRESGMREIRIDGGSPTENSFSATRIPMTRKPPVGPSKLAPIRWYRGVNADDHHLEIVTEGNDPRSLQIQLGHAWGNATWRPGGPIQIEMGSRQEISDLLLRSQIVSILRNVQGVSPEVLRALRDLAAAEPLEIHYPRNR